MNKQVIGVIAFSIQGKEESSGQGAFKSFFTCALTFSKTHVGQDAYHAESDEVQQHVHWTNREYVHRFLML